MKHKVENSEIEIDARGLECPIPVLKARKLSQTLKNGDIVDENGASATSVETVTIGYSCEHHVEEVSKMLKEIYDDDKKDKSS